MRNDPRVAPWARRFVEPEYPDIEPETFDGEVIENVVAPIVPPAVARASEIDRWWFRRVLAFVAAVWLAIFAWLAHSN